MTYPFPAPVLGDYGTQLNFEQLQADLGQRLPSMQSDVLPTAAAEFQGRIITVLGDGVTTGDVTSICLISAAGTYSWQTLASG